MGTSDKSAIRELADALHDLTLASTGMGFPTDEAQLAAAEQRARSAFGRMLESFRPSGDRDGSGGVTA